VKTIISVILPILLITVTASGVDKKHRGEKVSLQEYSADSLLQKADEIFQQQDYQTATIEYEQVLKAAREEFNNSVEVEALSQLARLNLILKNIDSARIFLAEASAKVSHSDPMGWSRYLGVKGRIEWKENNLVQARKTFDEMYNFCTVNSLWGRAIDAANMLAIVTDNPEEQIEWSYRGIEAAESAEQEKWLGPLWNNLGSTYYDMKNYDSALACYEKARDYHWRFSNENAKLFADYHIGMTYRYLGDYDNAGKWLRPVLAWAERIENHGAIGQASEDLGEIAIATGKKADGLKLLKKAREEYKNEGYDKSWPEIWENINKRITELE